MKVFKVKKIKVSTGEEIAYLKEGSGNKILLIHGNMSSSVFYYKTIEELSKYFEVYALDLRGFGDSSYNNKINSFYELSLDVEAFINEMELKDLNIVGWSAGGGVALELMANPKVKSKIKAVILLSSIGIRGINPINYTEYNLWNLNRSYFKGLNNVLHENMVFALDNMNGLYTKLFSFDTFEGRKNSLEKLYRQFVYNVKEVDEEEFNRNIEAALKQRNLKEIGQAIKNFDIVSNGKIKEIKTPILMLHGLKDLIVKPYIIEKSAKELGDNTSLKIFKNAGHSLMTDIFEEYIEEIINFFNKN
ncbi:alpha/beta fold hydrolase [Anaerosphaera multitolerans]|uniref:Alpha/beta hydrolase n=1 Tax=Anaerosphaera multitolerans TaxID=2487351 RepID=A0A437S9J9_9FIRM|nr:alpha/beta hydrolase [Anaerosphaera multitolerans]RVU55561.1 alpha/beta hydrolase [Anaerosphaera multitolerans]